MAQKLGLHLGLQQKLSPQQIQLIRLLEIPTAELESRIEEELEINPALEEGVDDSAPESDNEEQDFEAQEQGDEELSVSDYLDIDDYSGYKMQGDGLNEEEDRETPISSQDSFLDSILQQLGYLGLSERSLLLCQHLVGSLDPDGYLRRAIESIVNDLAFTQNIITSEEELLEALHIVQQLEPAGLGARDLRECLLLQLKRKKNLANEGLLAIELLENHFEEFSKKHFDKIEKKLSIDDQSLRAALKEITKLNPKPGSTDDDQNKAPYIIPDFILNNLHGKLELTLNGKNAPELRVSDQYREMFQTYQNASKKDKKMKEAVGFVKSKIDSARWFIDAIKQRQQTLLGTMHTIIQLQYEFFLDGDESKLKPMIMKDVADRVGLDISTISRVANSKSIQTEFGVFPLKYFFSEGISTDSGEDVSSREVKNTLQKLIEEEDKNKPLGDEELEHLLKEKGYSIARRTVAKYREQLNIPVARLRKEL